MYRQIISNKSKCIFYIVIGLITQINLNMFPAATIISNEDIIKNDTPVNRSQLREAAFYGDIEEVKQLISLGVSVNSTDWEGHTALMETTVHGQKSVAELLISAGANVDAADRMEKTALLFAVQQGYKKICELLIDGKADVNKVNRHKESPLMVAACKGHTEIVELLINSGANVDAIDDLGDTALLKASWAGHRQTVELLLTADADIDINNNLKITAIDAANSAYARQPKETTENKIKITELLLQEKQRRVLAIDRDRALRAILTSCPVLPRALSLMVEAYLPSDLKSVLDDYLEAVQNFVIA